MASVHDLCQLVKDVMPTDYHDSWYIVAATCLVACTKADELTGLYCESVKGKGSEERNRINKRLRDVLQKAWILTGIAPVLAGFTALAKGEIDEGHKNEGGLSRKWQTVQLTPEYHKRGTNFMMKLYQHDLQPTFENKWGSHTEDIQWQQEQVIYGVFLSDHSVLSAIETEMVTLSALMCGSYLPTKKWHLRGFRRLGPSFEDVQKIYKAIQLVAIWCGESVDDWPKPEEVEHEVKIATLSKL